jgi:hypothetical protein
MQCPRHNEKLTLSHGFTPIKGIDPKGKRYSCIKCTEYLYFFPKHGMITERDYEKLVLEV